MYTHVTVLENDVTFAQGFFFLAWCNPLTWLKMPINYLFFPKDCSALETSVFELIFLNY